ncbi:hypothetical protein BJ165DRAFT_1434177 [Panaeolus papilionaceus]|nr:hypothetical protein BJ165DRAFT_1434177 [Panaeolus papilionaceus]
MNGFGQSSTSSSNNFQDFSSNPMQATLFGNGITGNSQSNHHPQQQQQQIPSTPNLAQQLLQASQNAMLSTIPQQAGSTAWASQTPQHSMFSNNIPAALNQMAFSMPFISPQLIQEAYSLSTPVESSDEPLLIKHLLSYRKRNESYKDALNALHGHNSHSASLWKDYYLDHKDRLDACISISLQKDKEGSKTSSVIANAHNSMLEKPHRKPIPTVKKPSPASFKRDPSPRPSASRKTSKQPQKKSVSKSSTPVIETPIPSKKLGRSTLNSLTGPAPVYGNRLPPPNAEIKAPEPPSRSPTPPTRVISHLGRGNKYTQEDRKFFIKFIGWRLKHDSTLTRNDLCQALAEKAPHHSAQSWASHWSNNHDIPDKILAAARGEDFAEDSESSDNEVIPFKERPLYKDPSTTEESGESEGGDDESEDEQSDDDSDTPVREYSESEMGKKGYSYTDADIYICAKYIASIPGWFGMDNNGRWGAFSEKYNERALKSWVEFFRKNEKRVIKLVRKIQMQAHEQQHPSILTQTARPSHKMPLPDLKRKQELGMDSLTAAKRQRIEDSDDT